MKVIIWTDGSCHGNPGPGGWAYIIHFPERKNMIVMNSGSENPTTNNKMELEAVLQVLKKIDRMRYRVSSYTICSDSMYVINGLTKWYTNWIKKDFEGIKNSDRWKQIIPLFEKHRNKIVLKHVKGHSDILMNNMVDAIANMVTENLTITPSL